MADDEEVLELRGEDTGMSAVICAVVLFAGSAVHAAETDVPPTAYYAIDGLKSNVDNLRRVSDRGCNTTEVNSLDRSTEAYLYRAVYLSIRQLVHSDNAVKHKISTDPDQHIKNAHGLSERALNLTFEFADISRQAGCLDLAAKYYKRIVSTFVGNNFVAARERAQVAIDGLRAQLP